MATAFAAQCTRAESNDRRQKKTAKEVKLRLDQAYAGVVVKVGGGKNRADEQKGATAGLM